MDEIVNAETAILRALKNYRKFGPMGSRLEGLEGATPYRLGNSSGGSVQALTICLNFCLFFSCSGARTSVRP